MNQNVPLSIPTIVATVAPTAGTFVLPQQAFAHYGHHHHNNSNSIKVDKQINRLDNCTLALYDYHVNNDAETHQ